MILKIIVLLGNVILINSDKIYNYYELAVQKWCSSEYMIHGLWPQINGTAYPEYCKDVSYVKPKGELLINMNKYWHKCDDDTLWEHEWEKHGSCMNEQTNINEYDFFNTTITLFLENNKLLNNCIDDDCILGCFDLDYNLIECK
tara:strand:+ start:1767 stop:2198 length:432 start_codon:yes stop_codon:yes gene_type:complete